MSHCVEELNTLASGTSAVKGRIQETCRYRPAAVQSLTLPNRVLTPSQRTATSAFFTSPIGTFYFSLISNTCCVSTQHEIIAFYVRQEVCLLRGTDWIFKFNLGYMLYMDLRTNSDYFPIQH